MPLRWAASQIGSLNDANGPLDKGNCEWPLNDANGPLHEGNCPLNGANGPLHEGNCECPPNDASVPLHEGSVPHEWGAQNVGPLHERDSVGPDSSSDEGRNGRPARGGRGLVSVVEEREREGMCVRCTQRPCCRSHDYSRASEPWVLDIVLADLIC